MLVLSRLRDETIMIGDDIEITVVDIRGDKVRLGISAPTRVAVHRKEVYEAIKSENKRASTFAGDALPTIRPTAKGPGGPGKQTAGRIGALTSPPIRPGIPTSARSAEANGPAQTPIKSGPQLGPKLTDDLSGTVCSAHGSVTGSRRAVVGSTASRPGAAGDTRGVCPKTA